MIHFLENFLGCVWLEALDQVGSFVRVHFLDDIGGFFGVELLDHLRLKALVQFRDSSRRGFLVERIQDGLPLCRRDFLDDVGDIRRMKFGELVARKPQLHAPERIGFDQVDKLPSNGSPAEVVAYAANPHRGHQALEQPPDSSLKANVHLREPQFRVAVGVLVGHVYIVYANHLTAVRIDDLLIQQVFSEGQPGLVGMVELQRGLIRGQVHPAGLDGPYLVVSATSGRYLPRPISRRDTRFGCSAGTMNISFTRPTKLPAESYV